MKQFKGRITRIEKEQMTTSYLTQGIKMRDQWKYDNSNNYHGTNGTYTSGHHTDYYVTLYLTIYDFDSNGNRRVSFDIRDSILQKNDLKRISQKKMNEIQSKNVGKKVKFMIIDDMIVFNEGQLCL